MHKQSLSDDDNRLHVLSESDSSSLDFIVSKTTHNNEDKSKFVHNIKLPSLLFITILITISIVVAIRIFDIYINKDIDASPSSISQPVAVLPLSNNSVGNLQVSGYVVASEKATVSSDITGRIVEIHVANGDSVNKNDIIAVLDNRETKIRITEQRLNLQQSKINIKLASLDLLSREQELERFEKLARNKSISEHDIYDMREKTEISRMNLALSKLDHDIAENKLEALKILLERHTIRAPFKGIIIDVPARVGETVSPSSSGNSFIRTGIAHLIDPKDIYIEVEVPEQHLNKIIIHQAVDITAPALGDHAVQANVAWINPVSSRQRGVVIAGVQLIDYEPGLLDGMEVDVQFLKSAVKEITDDTQGDNYVRN